MSLPLFPWWKKYPNVNDEILNLDWLIYTVKKLGEEVSNFINLNTIKYADPILWDITSQYEANTVVIDPQTGNAYISTKAVPYGVSLSNTNYWTQIYNYASVLDTLREQIATDEGATTTATVDFNVGDLVFVNDLLYEVIAPIIAGNSFVVDSNISKITIESALKALKTLIEATDDKIGLLSDLNTTDKSSIVNAINELALEIDNIDIASVVFKNIKDYGAVGDGIHDDTQAFIDAFADSNAIIIPEGTFKVTDTIVIPNYAIVIGTGETSRIVGAFHGVVMQHNGEPIIIKNIVIERPSGFIAGVSDTGLEIGGALFAGRGVLENILVAHCYDGFKITGGSITTYNQLIAMENKNDGFKIINGRGELTNCLAQYNEGNGYHYYQESDGETGIEFFQCGTYVNQEYGFFADINTGVINAANLMLRGLSTSFDGAGGMFIDGFHNVWLFNSLSEYAGHSTDVKPAFNAYTHSVGIEIRNCHTVNLSGMIINHHKGTGLRLVASSDVMLNGNNISDNGSANVANYNYGTELVDVSYFVISGCDLRNITTSYQLFDLVIDATSKGIVDGVIFKTYYIPDSSKVRINNVGDLTAATVAAASDINLPLGADFVEITGDDNIYSIGTGLAGQITTLYFTGTGNVVGGSYLHLNSSPLAYKPGSTLTVVFINNTYGWNEIGNYMVP